MVEPLLFGIVLGMISVSLVGLLVAAYLQYRRDLDLEFLI
jgi:cytochrome b6-f complex subunit 5